MRGRHVVSLTLLLAATPRASLAQPTVTGPDDGQPTRGMILPGPETISVAAALHLEFRGECLTQQELADNVERWLEGGRINRRVAIDVTGEEKPELAARFWVLVDGQRASLRRFESFIGNCSELQSSLTAAIGLALEAVDLSEFPQPEPPKPKTLLPVARLTARQSLQPEPDRPLPPPPRRAKRPGVLQSAALGVWMMGGAGQAPGPTFGAGARGELGFNHGVGMRAGGGYLLMDEVPLADGGLEARVIAGQLGICWGRDTQRFRAQGCLDARGGAMIAIPNNLERQSVETLPWLAVAPGAEVRFHGTSDWGVWLGAQLSFNIVRPNFEVMFNTRDETLDRQTMPPLGLSVSLGLDWIAL